MEALFDWLAFTVKNIHRSLMTPEHIIQSIFKMDMEQFEQKPGWRGYDKQYNYRNIIRVLYDGRAKDMGIHVIITGQGVRYMENEKQVKWQEYFKTLLDFYEAYITRLDVAIDDKEGILDLDLLAQKVDKNELVSLWTDYNTSSRYKRRGEIIKGTTVYFGARESLTMCRFYDKRANEIMKKHEEELPEHWIRCELELKNERANIFARKYFERFAEKQEECLGELITGVLNHYLRICDKGSEERRSRWKACEMWGKFIRTVEKVKLTTAEMEKPLEELYHWFKANMSPTLARLYMNSGKKMDFLMELLEYGIEHMQPKYVQEIAERQKEETGETYAAIDWRHDMKERVYNTEWQIMEKTTRWDKVDQMLKMQFEEKKKEVEIKKEKKYKSGWQLIHEYQEKMRKQREAAAKLPVPQ